MNRLFATLILLGCLIPAASHQRVRADEPSEQSKLAWTKAFEPISATEPAGKLVMLVITNDDPFNANETGESRSLWCTPIIESVLRKAARARSDLKDKFILQSLAAGTPKLLSGGVDRNQPQRAIVLACDVNYRLLSMQIGVPDEQSMLTLVEDAQFVQTLLQLHPGGDVDNSTKRSDEIVKYNAMRMPRLWHEALKAMVTTVRQDADDEATKTTTENRDGPSHVLHRRLLARIGESYEEIYLTDVKQRFALSEASDLVRLTVIEQHPQARQPWCDAMIPLIAESDVRTDWRYLAEMVWKRPPVINPADIKNAVIKNAVIKNAVIKNTDEEQLLDWWDQKIESGMVILAIKPPILASLRPWPPVNVDNAADKRGLGWKDLEHAAAKHSFRHVSHQQLATMLRIRELKPIDILLPTPARYVLFERNRHQGVTIHESEIPAKYINRIKRAIRK